MSRQIPFQLENFSGHCDTLLRVGIDPGLVLYTNQHASNGKPAARLLADADRDIVQAYLNAPSDEVFKRLVAQGVFLDTEWDRNTSNWQIIDFAGWEVLHDAFSRLHAKSDKALQTLTGLSDRDIHETT
ncbi:hypothetical protein KEF85_03005 [Methylomonas paludis]|uniref:Uncharacterized protein n=1 Tax=Methylomonas paludis TaxID=1173101 RepID=A0A975R9I4_9GAMM|nr:hypothetical protein [Methylomonas paludis]QWF71465.1 hypothetical protein KEF85_03005 [Methylomonas paludis]